MLCPPPPALAWPSCDRRAAAGLRLVTASRMLDAVTAAPGAADGACGILNARHAPCRAKKFKFGPVPVPQPMKRGLLQGSGLAFVA
eukprot:scaffold36009_cov60-Phaeocystis_antarctica.AAC.5